MIFVQRKHHRVICRILFLLHISLFNIVCVSLLFGVYKYVSSVRGIVDHLCQLSVVNDDNDREKKDL